jgi:Flp pilus assembly pilin Flp
MLRGRLSSLTFSAFGPKLHLMTRVPTIIRGADAPRPPRAAPPREEERGAGLVEYVLIACFISILAVVSMTLIGRTVSRQFSTVRHNGFEQSN